jgi:predicted nucleotidyltransferase
MKSSLHDLSSQTELALLGKVVWGIQQATQGLDAPMFLMGAAARDTMLHSVYGIRSTRLTEDMDFGVMVADWPAFEAARKALLAGGDFSAQSTVALHKLRHQSGAPLDVVPFGGVERADRTLAWPPDGQTVFSCFGMKEALESAERVLLPGGTELRVASLPAQVILKLMAWQDRKHTHPGRDASDLLHVLKHYLDCGTHMDRAAVAYPEMFTSAIYEHEVTSARLVGLDMRNLLDEQARQQLIALIEPEANLHGSRVLAQQSGVEDGLACRMLAGLCDGLRAS